MAIKKIDELDAVNFDESNYIEGFVVVDRDRSFQNSNVSLLPLYHGSGGGDNPTYGYATSG
jgi:hypothetical protein